MTPNARPTGSEQNINAAEVDFYENLNFGHYGKTSANMKLKHIYWSAISAFMNQLGQYEIQAFRLVIQPSAQ